jgi:homocysteine S-methyltransferase
MTSRYRHDLPQLAGGFFLADAGLETDLIFNQGIEVREFAAHTLLTDTQGRQALADYFRPFLALAGEIGAGFILDSQTWKAHRHWASDLGSNARQLRQANEDSIAFIAKLRDEFATNDQPIVLNGIIGPRGDGYSATTEVAVHEAEDYHAQQIGWLADTEIDMVTATTFTQSDEAIGIVRAARAAGLPIVVSFTVETDGSLPTGQPLGEAIAAVDAATESQAAYFLVNCAHPDHFFHVLETSAWARRIRGVRCNASRRSHAELDQCESLDDGDPVELAGQCAELGRRLPWLNVFGGCCGSDLRHVTEIARVFTA